jgi:hypothetical protein
VSTGALSGGMLVSKGAVIAVSTIGFLTVVAVIGVGLSLGLSK